MSVVFCVVIGLHYVRVSICPIIYVYNKFLPLVSYRFYISYLFYTRNYYSGLL
jgi:hypothetical protein